MVSVLPLPLLICGRGTGIESVRRKRFINFVTGLALALAPVLTFTAISLFNATMSNKLRGWCHDHSRVTLTNYHGKELLSSLVRTYQHCGCWQGVR